MPDRWPPTQPVRAGETELQALVRMAAKLSNLGAWAIEVPAMRLTWSEEVCAIHEVEAGYEPTVAEAICFYAPEHVPLVSEAVTRCIEAGQAFDLELQIITAKGRRLWVRAVGEAIRDASGEIVKVQGAFQDLSKIKALTEQNEALTRSLAQALESMSDAFFTLDRNWRFRYLNPKSEVVLERPRAALVGRSVWEEFPHAVGTRFEAEYRKALRDNVAVEFVEFYRPLERWFEVRAYPSTEGLAVYFHDVSRQMETQQALRRMTEELEKRVELRTAELSALASEMEAFSYSIAHDLRAPVQTVGGYAQVLAETEHERLSERGRNYLRKIRVAAGRMDKMIDGLLHLAKLPNAEVQFTEFDITAAARRILARLKLSHPQRSIEALVEKGLRARGDPRLLEQVLENLLANSVKFTSNKEQARIEVGVTTTAAGERTFFIADNGAGFDMAYAQRLFQVFHRQHTDQEFPGTGVGLAIVRRIIQRHGGRIWADAAPEAGATFFFTLPES